MKYELSTGVKFGITFLIAVVLITFCYSTFNKFFHKLENQNLGIIQSVSGDLQVRRTAGWWFQAFPTIVTYPKAGMYRLNASDGDSLEIQFNNKSKASLNAAIGYRIDGATDETIIALHQQVEGNDEKVWEMVLTALNTIAQSITTKYDPSSVIGGDKFEPMVREISTAIMHNPSLLAHGIDVNYFAVDGRPLPDKETEEQFIKQKEADLSRRLAEAEKLKLEAETIKTQANYEREIAEFKGKADAETAKQKTEALRQKELAEIAAKQQVEVAKLEKERAEIEVAKQKEVARIEAEKAKEVASIEAEKLLAVAEIQKKTEAEKLEAVRLQAEQQIEQAKAKKQAIELSGAITEVQKAELELQRQVAQYKWENLGKGLAGIKLPAMLNLGGSLEGGAQKVDAIERLVDVITLEKLNENSNPVK